MVKQPMTRITQRAGTTLTPGIAADRTFGMSELVALSIVPEEHLALLLIVLTVAFYHGELVAIASVSMTSTCVWEMS